LFFFKMKNYLLADSFKLEKTKWRLPYGTA
jgi:hypothetical protein